jgi:protein subunit release factor B
MFRAFWPSKSIQFTSTALQGFHQSAVLRRVPSYVDAKPEDIQAARKYLDKLKPDNVIHSKLCSVSFSRSSGPGGQNVNK